MKRVRCPKCNNSIVFDETNYAGNQALSFACPDCGKKFAVRLNVSKRKSAFPEEDEEEKPEYVGTITVIENVFHYKQVIPLIVGENVIGRYQKGIDNNCAIHTDDPSVDITHCHINISRDKQGRLKFVLRDGPSNTGTFVDNEILGDRERRVIEDGTLFTIGATSVILSTHYEEESEA